MQENILTDQDLSNVEQLQAEEVQKILQEIETLKSLWPENPYEMKGENYVVWADTLTDIANIDRGLFLSISKPEMFRTWFWPVPEDLGRSISREKGKFERDERIVNEQTHLLNRLHQARTLLASFDKDGLFSRINGDDARINYLQALGLSDDITTHPYPTFDRIMQTFTSESEERSSKEVSMRTERNAIRPRVIEFLTQYVKTLELIQSSKNIVENNRSALLFTCISPHRLSQNPSNPLVQEEANYYQSHPELSKFSAPPASHEITED